MYDKLKLCCKYKIHSLKRQLFRGKEQERGLEQRLKAFIQDNIPKERILHKLEKRFKLTKKAA